MQLCNAHGLPLVSLVDTPGFMVVPEAEAEPQCATSAACSWPPRTCACRSSRSCCARGINMAATLEVDAVIDPAQTREWLVKGLASAGFAWGGSGSRACGIDPW